MWQTAGASIRDFFRRFQTAWAAQPIHHILLLAIIFLAVFAALLFSFDTWLDKRTSGWEPIYVLLLWTAIGTLTGGAVHFVYTKVLQLAGWEEPLAQSDSSAQRSHEFASQFFGVVGVIYAVLVAFVVVTAWQARSYAEDLTIEEQHNVDYLFHLNEGYPSKDARVIRILLRDYAVNTLAEWAQMAREEPLCRDISESDVLCLDYVGAVSRRANDLAHCVADLTISLPSATLDSYDRKSKPAKSTPAPWANRTLYQQDLSSLEGISENRQERRARYNERTLQPILWQAFLLGALLLSGMSYFVPGQSARGKLVRTCALFGMVGMMTAIALVFDRPLAGTTQINGSGWTRLIRHFDHDLAKDAEKHGRVPPGYFATYCKRDESSRSELRPWNKRAD